MQVIIITGASEGIGAALARRMAERLGSSVALVLAARSANKLEAVAEDCRRFGAHTFVRPADLSIEAEARGLVADTATRFGRIDTLINNAGMSAHAYFEDVEDLGFYEQLMSINYWGAVWCTHAALPHIKLQRGRIAAVSSLAGLTGVPGRTAYSSTKFAMAGFFDALRTEVARHGVSVTVVYPGVVLTDIRKHGYSADGTPAGESGLIERGAMSAETCALLTDLAVERRQRELVMTMKGKLGRWMKLVAPGLVDRMAWAAIAKRSKPS